MDRLQFYKYHCSKHFRGGSQDKPTEKDSASKSDSSSDTLGIDGSAAAAGGGAAERGDAGALSSTTLSDDEKSKIECYICTDLVPFDEFEAMPCKQQSHRCCKSCFAEWCAKSRKITCPICRKEDPQTKILPANYHYGAAAGQHNEEDPGYLQPGSVVFTFPDRDPDPLPDLDPNPFELLDYSHNIREARSILGRTSDDDDAIFTLWFNQEQKKEKGKGKPQSFGDFKKEYNKKKHGR